MATVTTCDPKSYELAEYFLSEEADLNSDAAKMSLALEIQQCIEDEIWFMRKHPELYPTLAKTSGIQK